MRAVHIRRSCLRLDRQRFILINRIHCVIADSDLSRDILAVKHNFGHMVTVLRTDQESGSRQAFNSEICAPYAVVEHLRMFGIHCYGMTVRHRGRYDRAAFGTVLRNALGKSRYRACEEKAKAQQHGC